MAITNEGDSQSFAYTGGMQSFTAPQKGIYRLEVWGARGAPGHGGGYQCGGYGCGYRLMEKGEVIYICCGQAGSQGAKAFSYNGGATGAANAGALGGSGGGATHMATMTGTLEAIGSGNLSKILVVAGGSGGGNRGWGGYKASGTAGGGAQSDTCGDSSVFGKGVAGTASTWLEDLEYACCCGGGGGGLYGGSAEGLWYGSGRGGCGYIGGVPAFTYGGVTYAPSWMTDDQSASGDGFARITFVKKGELPISFNGTMLQKLIFNGTEVTGLIVNGTRLFFERLKRRMRAWHPRLRAAS